MSRTDGKMIYYRLRDPSVGGLAALALTKASSTISGRDTSEGDGGGG
jgi:hypothetical protein